MAYPDRPRVKNLFEILGHGYLLSSLLSLDDGSTFSVVVTSGDNVHQGLGFRLSCTH